jgi:Lanthionine synthetase C-like protein/Protein kinase domain
MAVPVENNLDQPILLDLMNATLARNGCDDWSLEPGDFWCQVTPPDYSFRPQAWKIHVSATPLSAPIVLARCATVLVRSGCAFKFAGDLAKVHALVERTYPRGSGGKFMTAYPVDDEQFRQIAADLDKVTLGLHGPKILSDRQLRPGSLVHYRYGVGGARPVLTNDGNFASQLVAPDGTMVPDQRLAWFSPPPWAGSPFPGVPVMQPTPPETVRLADRFVVRRAVRHANKGGIYVADDTTTGTEVIIKHARRHIGAGLDGTDSRDYLRHEAEMLDAFAPLGISPGKIALFEQQGDLFLAEELIPGARLETWAAAKGGKPAGGALSASAAIELAARLVDVFATAQGTGLVLRDFNPNNLMVMPDNEFRLIDLEFAVRPGDQVLRCVTPGYAAPEQAEAAPFSPAPGQEADLYSLGATLFYLVTGTHPLFPADTADTPPRRHLGERLAELIALMAPDNAALAELAEPIRGLMDEVPGKRWTVARARGFLAERAPAAQARVQARRPGQAAAPPDAQLDPPDLDVLVRDGLTHVLKEMTPDAARLWASDDFGAETDPCSVQHGAAGTLGVLMRADQAGERTGASAAGLRDALAVAAAWIAGRLDAVPRLLPGLYFGRSGTAWALHDAASYLGDAGLAARAIGLAEGVPVTGWGNPDICHGLAGAGLAQLHLWQATGLDSFRQRALHCADAVLGAARSRGAETMWPVAASFDSSLAGLEHYGFAHGVAGAGAFLLYAGVAANQESYLAAAVAAGHTLRQAARPDAEGAWPDAEGAGPDTGGAWWPAVAKPNPADPEIQHWCNGASGIGTFLIRLWRVTGDRRFLDLAERAAVTVRRRRWHVGNSVCHGLAGDGEFLLDMAQFTGQPKYAEWAQEMAAVIYARRVYLDGLAVAYGDNPMKVTADFGTGLSGILGFLVRLRHQGARPFMPDSLLPAPSLPAPSLPAPSTR